MKSIFRIFWLIILLPILCGCSGYRLIQFPEDSITSEEFKSAKNDESDRLVRVTMNSGEIHVGILAEIGPDSIDVWIPDSGGAIQSFSARDVLKLEEYEGGSPWASLGVASLVVGGVMGGYYILNYDQPSATPDWSPAK